MEMNQLLFKTKAYGIFLEDNTPTDRACCTFLTWEMGDLFTFRVCHPWHRQTMNSVVVLCSFDEHPYASAMSRKAPPQVSLHLHKTAEVEFRVQTRFLWL